MHSSAVSTGSARILGVALAAFVMLGCGSPQSQVWPVAGRVTLHGKPVSAGSIRFSNPAAHIDIVASLDADGRYTVVTARGAGLPQGDYQVAILPGGRSAPVGSFVPVREPSQSEIPTRYRQSATSGLTAAVKAEPNVFDVDMKSGQ